MNNIFFDLDGTLINAGKRMYSLFKFLVPQSKLTYSEYWDLKRHKVNHQMILQQRFGYDEERFKVFEKEWLSLIETDEYLAMDTIYPNVPEMLSELQKDYTLYVVTARQFKQKTLGQLQALGLLGFFKKVLVTEAVKTKEDLIRQEISTLDPEDLLIGDTGHDILTAKALNVRSVAVSYGFTALEILKTYEPDQQIKSIKDLNR